MGVLRCDRKGCENIMCDRLSRTHGYICSECFEELCNLGPEANITEFMNSQKSEHFETEAFARFNVAFPII
jgi:hypothetical protein